MQQMNDIGGFAFFHDMNHDQLDLIPCEVGIRLTDSTHYQEGKVWKRIYCLPTLFHECCPC